MQKIKDSQAIKNQSYYIPVTKHQRLIYSKTKPHGKILKYDPYLSLYLVEDKHGFAYPFDTNLRVPLGIAGVDRDFVLEGRFKTNQIGLNHLATFSSPLQTPSLILTSCCSLEGIVTPRGIIQKEYINHFLRTKKVSYSDFGIRVAQLRRTIVVKAVNPFFQNNKFKKGDFIISLDGKKIKSASLFMRKVLFSKIGSKHKVIVKRGTKKITLLVIAKKRLGGGELSDTFLEFLGISFDKHLKIIDIAPKAKKYNLKLGDVLMQINRQDVKDSQQIYDAISKSKDSTYLLFQRDNFQFFVKIN